MGQSVRLQARAVAALRLFVDTCVWSLLFRRDRPSESPEAGVLVRAIEAGVEVVTTGLVLQELLQGFSGPKSSEQIVSRFAALPMLTPDRGDHIAAAALQAQCRRGGIQIGTIDALLAMLCVRHKLTLLSTDGDFKSAARFCPLSLWQASH